jgi:hypothetical protein
MMPTIEIICLANSRKYNHHCVAGLRTDGNGWLRPIGSVTDGSLYANEILLQDGSQPLLLDVIRIGCSIPQPRPHQPENWSIDKTEWQLVARPAPPTIMPIFQSGAVKGPDILGGQGDRINYDDFLTQPAKSSLALIVPENLRWRITTSQRGNRQTRACFSLNGAYYDLAVTDPIWENRVGSLAEGMHDAMAAGLTTTDVPVFTVSLGEPFYAGNNTNQSCFKLIAGIMLLQRKTN